MALLNGPPLGVAGAGRPAGSPASDVGMPLVSSTLT
jgi:hypothetical protein